MSEAALQDVADTCDINLYENMHRQAHLQPIEMVIKYNMKIASLEWQLGIVLADSRACYEIAWFSVPAFLASLV